MTTFNYWEKQNILDNIYKLKKRESGFKWDRQNIQIL